MRTLKIISWTLFHLCAFALNAFSLYELERKLAKEQRGALDAILDHGRFLTVWGVAIQAVFFFCRSVVDILKLLRAKKVSTSLSSFNEACFVAICFPLSITIPILFWTLYHIDRDLIFPEKFDAFFPSYLNHLLHTAPGILITIECFSEKFRYQPKRDLALCLAVSAAYSSLLVYRRVMFGQWEYPVFDQLPLVGQVLFLLGGVVVSFATYYLGRFVHWVFGSLSKAAVKME